MSVAKKKQTKYSKKKKTPKKIAEVNQCSFTGKLRPQTAVNYIFSGLLVLYLLYYLFQLYASLDTTFFWADENKHAYISSLILKNHQIPVVLPAEMYGEFQWSYPPLFHVIGATVQGIAGFPALKYTNIILLIIFICAFYILLFKYYGHAEALIACLLVSLAPVVAVNAIRFTTDMLAMLLTFLSVFFFLLALKETKTHFAVFCGISTGLLMLSKQTGLIVASFYFLLLPWFWWKSKKDFRLMLYVVAVSLSIYVPYLIWALSHGTGVFGFINLFLAKRPEWALLGAKSFRRYDSALKEFAVLIYKGAGWVFIVSLLLPLIYFIRKRLKGTPQIYAFLIVIYLSAVMVIWHITNDRHIIVLVPLMALLVGYSICQIVPKKIMPVAIILLFIIAGYAVFQMPDHRQRYNRNGKDFMPLAKKLKDNHSSFNRILTVNKFDVLVYTQKPVIWPHPRLNKNPLDLLEQQSPQNLFNLLKSYEIKYVLINLGLVTNTGVFWGRNYPITLVRNLEQLERQGKLTLEGISKSKKFILLKVS